MRDVFRKIRAGRALTRVIGSTVKRNVPRPATILYSVLSINSHSTDHLTISSPGLDDIKIRSGTRELHILALETAAAGGNEITHRERVRSIAGKNEFSPARMSPSCSAMNFQIQSPR